MNDSDDENFRLPWTRYFDVNKGSRELRHSAFYLSSSSLFHMLLSESLQNLIFLPLPSSLLLSSYDIQIKWEFEKNLGNTIKKINTDRKKNWKDVH